MADVFCWSGIVIGLVGFIACMFETISNKKLVLKKPFENNSYLLSSVFVLLATLIVWFAANQKHPPFSFGQTFSIGFLIGGLASILIFYTMESAQSKFIGLFFGLLLASIVFKIFSGYPQEALFGILSAQLTAAFIYRFSAGIENDNFIIVTSLIPVSIILGVLHFGNTAKREFWSLPLLLVSLALISAYIGAKINIPKLGSQLSAIFSSALLYLLASAGAGFKGIHDPRVFWISLIAIISGIFCYLISKAEFSKPISKSSVIIILIIALSSASFTIWGGYGITLALIAFLTVLIPSDFSEVAETLKSLAYLILSIAILKVYTDTWSEDYNPIKLKSHYAMLGIVLGALLPFLIFESASKPEKNKKPFTNLLWLCYIGIMMIFGFLAIFLIWGLGIIDGFVVGSVIACAISGVFLKEFKSSIGFLAVSIQILLFKIIHQHFWQELDRHNQIMMLGILVVLIIIPILVGWGLEYKESRRQI